VFANVSIIDIVRIVVLVGCIIAVFTALGFLLAFAGLQADAMTTLQASQQHVYDQYGNSRSLVYDLLRYFGAYPDGGGMGVWRLFELFAKGMVAAVFALLGAQLLRKILP